jgi:hypothetical protein
MRGTQKGGTDRPLADVVRSIPWLDSDANRVLTQKTRRAVRDAVISTQEKRTLQRRNLGFAILGFVFMLVLLGPAIWNGMEDLLLEEEHLFDMPTQLALLIAMLLLAMLAALIAVWKGQRHVYHDRGGVDTFPQIEK